MWLTAVFVVLTLEPMKYSTIASATLGVTEGKVTVVLAVVLVLTVEVFRPTRSWTAPSRRRL